MGIAVPAAGPAHQGAAPGTERGREATVGATAYNVVPLTGSEFLEAVRLRDRHQMSLSMR